MGASVASARRKTVLGAIHAGKKALGWDDETYRAVLAQIAGTARFVEAGRAPTTSLMTDSECGRVLDVMRDRGFRRTGRSAAWASCTIHDQSASDARPQLQLIRELWASLGEMPGALRNPSAAGLRGYVARMTQVSTLEWLTVEQASKVIEGLKAMHARACAGREA